MDPNTNSGGAPPAGAPTVPPAGNPPEPPPAGGEEPISLDAARKLRQENQSLRERAKRLEELETKERQRQEAELTEAQKAQKRAEAAEAERDAARRDLAAARLERAVSAAASRLHFVDPDDALALLDRAALDIDDATGAPDPDKLERALTALLKRKPYLAAPTGTPAPNTPPAPPPPGPPTNPPRPAAGAPPPSPTKVDWQHLPSWGAVLTPPKS